MNCPNCSNVFHEGNICPKCGIDVVLFDKTIKISDVLYNKGLSLAKVQDLWGAMETLTKSIQFNKNNYYARNLLGLVYYETGRIGDALKHWVISASLVKQDNPAIRYIDYFQQEGKRIDLYNDAIKMYNQALVYIQQKSDDMAIIQLKKALDINPSFVDAMNLLTFCYLIQEDNMRAAELVDKVLEIDINNPIALNYYTEIHSSKKRPKPVDNKIEVKPPVFTGTGANKLTPQESKKGFGNNFYFAEILSFLIGGICTLALLYTLVIPGMVSERDNSITQLQDQLEQLEQTHRDEITAKDGEITRLETASGELSDENALLRTQLDVQEISRRISVAAGLYDTNESEEAAAMIYTMGTLDPSLYDEDVVETYERIKTGAYAAAGQSLYNTAVTQFNNGNNEDAKRNFETCLRYAPEDSIYIDDATYFLGEIAYEEEDYDKALQLFKAVIEQYPDSNRYNNAENRINELEADDAPGE